MTAPKFLVLGSNSFSGASFVDYLAGQGHDVMATSRSDEPHEAMLPYKWREHGGAIRFQRIDINNDLDALEKLLKEERFTHVVNFAAQSMVGQSWDHPDDWMRTNTGRDGDHCAAMMRSMEHCGGEASGGHHQ